MIRVSIHRRGEVNALAVVEVAEDDVEDFRVGAEAIEAFALNKALVSGLISEEESANVTFFQNQISHLKTLDN